METNRLIKATKIAIHIALANEREAINKLEIAEEELQKAREISNNKISLLQELLEEE